MADSIDFEQQDLTKINRIEVIDEEGRSYVKYGVTNLELHFQDEGKTLKLFVRVD